MKRQLKKKLALALAAAALAGIFAGCGGAEAGMPEATTGEQTGSAEKELVIGVTSFADTLEPTEQYFSWVVSRYGVGETLVQFDTEGELTPCLAEAWQISEDGLTWTFRIREGVRFSDGEEMTTALVKASLERTFALSHRAETFFVPQSIAAEGQELHITTAEPVAILPGSLADPLFLIVTTSADTGSFAMEGPVCTGPYMVQSFSPVASCEVVRNPYYWGGEAPLDKVTFKCIDDQTTRSMALQAGEIDIAYNLKTENIAEFEGREDITIQKLQSLRSTYAFMNQNGVLADKTLRQAVIRALDRETYCNILLAGGATAGKAPIPPTLDFGFDTLADENAYDPEGAKALLREAGYVDTDSDGYVETPQGEPVNLNFVIYTSREELGIYAQAAQVSLKEIGIQVTLHTVSYETLLDMRDTASYDLLIWNVLVANTGDPEKYLRENWHSTSPSNTSGYSNGAVDALLDEMSAEFEEARRQALAAEIQQHIMDDAATVFFGYETTYLFCSDRVEGAALYPIDYYWLTSAVTLKD